MYKIKLKLLPACCIILFLTFLFTSCSVEVRKSIAANTGEGGQKPMATTNIPVKDTTAGETNNTQKNTKALKGRQFYVAKDGDNYNPGTEGKPFLTISNAIAVAEPGDIIYVKEGTYNETVVITQQGKPDAWLTLKAYGDSRPLVETSDEGAFWVKGGAYIEINGFAAVSSNRYGCAVRVDQSKDKKANSHHIRVYNNILKDSGQSGIGTSYSDYIHAKGNICFGNSRLSEYQGSGISLWEGVKFDNEPGFHNIVEDNICYDNMNGTDSPWFPGHTDGNGIIIDYPGHGVAEDAPGTLVRNNICFDNGGRGISLTHASHTLVINNTCYKNSKDKEQYFHNVEFEIAEGTDNIVRNNIFYGIGGYNITSYYKAENVITQNNCYYNGNANNTGENPVIGDPLFFSPTTSPAKSEFRLNEGSPCINAGTNEGAPERDISGIPRPKADKCDIGAYEMQ